MKYDGFQRVVWLFEVLLPGSTRYAASALWEPLLHSSADNQGALNRTARLYTPTVNLAIIPSGGLPGTFMMISIQCACELMWAIQINIQALKKKKKQKPLFPVQGFPRYRFGPVICWCLCSEFWIQVCFVLSQQKALFAHQVLYQSLMRSMLRLCLGCRNCLLISFANNHKICVHWNHCIRIIPAVA